MISLISLLKARKPLAVFMAVTFTCLTLGWAPARASLVTTAQVVEENRGSPDRDRVMAFLDRADVQQKLQEWGVDAEAAKARVDGLTNEEVSQLSRHLDRLPAGGDSLGTVLGVILIIFLVLLFTDIMGWTDVFPFVKKHY